MRTRPDFVPYLENMVIRAMEDAGGKVSRDRSLIQAVFDEKSLAFWLDMLVLTEKLRQILADLAADLFGYSVFMGEDPGDTCGSLCRLLSGGQYGGGIFLDVTAAGALRPYLVFEENGEWAAKLVHYNTGVLFKVSEIKIMLPTAKTGFPLLETSANYLEPEQRQATLVIGQSFDGKRDDLYRRFAAVNRSLSGDFQPLFVRFGGGGLSALTDSFARWIQTSLETEAADRELAGEMERCREFLFRQRLKTDPSPFTIRTGRRFFNLLIGAYRNIAKSRNTRAVVILENIHEATAAETGIVIEALYKQEDVLLLGTCSQNMDSTKMARWKPMFGKQLKSHGNDAARLPELPHDLWEIGYLCSLLGRFFPPDMLPQLLEEAGKNPAMISRAVSLLHTFRILDTPLDPRPWQKAFLRQAEAALGGSVGPIRLAARSILLAWVLRKKLGPCVHLLEILADLAAAETIDASLVMQSLYGELSGESSAALETAVQGVLPETIAGPENAPALRYIAQALLAIHFGAADTITAAFAQPFPGSTVPLFRAQALFCQSLYHLGQRKSDSALEAVKEATQLCRGSNDICLAHYYRGFAIASLSQKRISETIDYLNFALENAEKNGGAYETGLAAYYAASIQLLHGNLSRAQNLAEKAGRHFIRAGSPDWADRSRFLEGRLAFETGCFMQAIEIFEEIQSGDESAGSPEKNGLLEAWIYRAKVHGFDPLTAKPENGGLDAALFVLEALYLAEDFSRVAELSGIDVQFNAEKDFLFTERPDWRSGFAQCEMLYVSHADLWNRLFSVFHSMAESRLSPANNEKALHEIQGVLRNRDFQEIDPFDIFYHYAWHRILQQTSANQVDINTAVSAAFKRLQDRASRIDDREIRRKFLTQPRWNNALAGAAREFKLV